MPNLKLWGDRELTRLRQDLERLFEDLRQDCGLSLEPEATPFETSLADTGPELVITVHLGRADTSCLSLTVDDTTLTIEATRREDHQGGRAVRTVRKSLELPCRIDNEKASAVRAGDVLEIRLPKKDNACRIRVPICTK